MPSIDDRITTVTAEAALGHAHAYRCLAALVLAAVHQLDHLVDVLGAEARLDDPSALMSPSM